MLFILIFIPGNSTHIVETLDVPRQILVQGILNWQLRWMCKMMGIYMVKRNIFQMIVLQIKKMLGIVNSERPKFGIFKYVKKINLKFVIKKGSVSVSLVILFWNTILSKSWGP